MLECLLSKNKALSSDLSTTKTRKGRKKRRRRRRRRKDS
jgi:hypothetical protein